MRSKERSSETNGKGSNNRVPVVMLSLLLAAFGGALGLKAHEEMRASDAHLLNAQLTQSRALSSHIRAELVTTRTRIETLLNSNISLGNIRERSGLERIRETTEPNAEFSAGQIALNDNNGLEIYVQSANGKWVIGEKSATDLIPENTSTPNASLLPLASAPAGNTFIETETGRIARSCTSVPNTAILACVEEPAPRFQINDLYTAFIYLLLLMAPLLAVIGLIQVILRTNDKLTKSSASTTAKEPSPLETHLDPINHDIRDTTSANEVTDLIGRWTYNPHTQTIILGRVAASMLGAARIGEISLADFLDLIELSERDPVQNTLLSVDKLDSIHQVFPSEATGTRNYFEMIGAFDKIHFAGFFFNVTDRIQAKAQSRLADAVSRAAINAHPGPFAIWDSRRRLTHWNKAFETDFNLEPGTLDVGVSYDFVMAEMSKFVRVDRPVGEDSNAREIYLISDRWLRLVDRRTAGGGLITVGLDISALKHHETSLSRNDRKLRAMVTELQRTRGQARELANRYAEEKAKAERASQAKSVFLANMSHELRTPLNAINGFSEMIAQQVYGPVGDERYQGYATDILESGQHLLDLINDILDMAKIEAGKMQITPRPIDPSDAVDAAVRLIRRRASDKGVSLSFDADDDLPDINGDHLAIKQMSLNLISNAIKFTEAEGKIQVGVFCEDKWIKISVKDSGIGISEEDLPRLAQPFEQAGAPEGQNTQGTGLGLALTKSFAEMHGGKLEIESTLGEGTTVSIYLPIDSNLSSNKDDEQAA